METLPVTLFVPSVLVSLHLSRQSLWETVVRFLKESLICFLSKTELSEYTWYSMVTVVSGTV